MKNPEKWTLTRHAKERMAERGICERDMAYLRRFGVERAGDRISLPERAIKRIAHEEAKAGVSAEEITHQTKRRRGLTCIKQTGRIITAYRDDRYGHKRRGGGWRENKRGWNLAAWRFAEPGQI